MVGRISAASRPRRSGSSWGRGVMADTGERVRVDFRTEPSKYRHWRLAFDGRVATRAMDVKEDGGLRPGYELKLNSYDLGVDVELYDAIQRLRIEHPEVGAVIVTSAKERVFCAGANIRMLSQSAHGWKVNFCKFTNETRNAIEEATGESRQFYLCSVNGPCAGGGYELALATDWIVMADDGNTAVSLPEVPLLAVLPGTGGLTRLVDKRRVRRDRAAIREAGVAFWPRALARELDDLILHLRTNEDEIGLWVFKTSGRGDLVEAYDRVLAAHRDDWLVREIRLYLKRTFKRVEVSSRSVFALVEPGSCFVGTLLELVLAADRSYMLDGGRPGDPKPPATIRLTQMNFAAYPMVNRLTRLASRFLAEPGRTDKLRARIGEDL